MAKIEYKVELKIENIEFTLKLIVLKFKNVDIESETPFVFVSKIDEVIELLNEQNAIW